MNKSRLALLLLAAFLASTWTGAWTPDSVDVEPTPVLEIEVEPEFVASPGHVVFGQYITSTNCGYCMNYGSPAHNKLKADHPADYTYVAYHSASYGNTATAAAGNVAPIYAVSHLGESGGAPKSSFGDSLPLQTGCGSNTCWDSSFAPGGNMHSTVGDYEMLVGQAENGGNVDITVGVKYIGSGTAPLTSYTVYAAVTEGVCSHAYTNGYKGGHCWAKWLTNSGNTGFETVDLRSGNWEYANWSVPSNTVSGGYSNMVTVAALMDGWSTSSANQNVYTAADSTMAPLIDVGLTGFSMTNQAGTASWKPNDVIDLSVMARNNGVDAYTDGGTLGFYLVEGQSETLIDSTSLNSLNPSGVGSTQTFTATFDTATLGSDPSFLTVRAKLTNLVSDGTSVNNAFVGSLSQDRAPEANSPVPLSTPDIQRGASAEFEVTAIDTDAVDTLEDMTVEFEVAHATNMPTVWGSDWVSGGESVLAAGTTSARYEFAVTPPLTAPSGTYDVRVRLTDAGGLLSPWAVTEDAFSLLNAAPSVTASPFPTVQVERIERISLVAHVSDAETPLADLSITSTSPSFLGWFPGDEEIEVRFDTIPTVGGNPVPANLPLTVSDGEDTTSGTLQINVIENGAPRWRAVPTQQFDEGGSVAIALTQYLTDTNADGSVANPANLAVSVRSVSDVNMIEADLSGHTLTISAVDDDATGQANVTVRASDGMQMSEQTITVFVNNVNDAPRIDASGFDGMVLEVGETFSVNMSDRIVDVDDPAIQIFTQVLTLEPGAARFNMLSGELTLMWETAGDHDVSIVSRDRHDAVATETFTVSVVSNLPLYLTTDASNTTADLYFEASSLYVDTAPVVNVTLLSSLQFTELSVEWQACNDESGICHTFGLEDLDVSETSWVIETSSEDLVIRYMDVLKFYVTGTDADGKERVQDHEIYFGPITELAPATDDVTNDGGDVDTAGASAASAGALTYAMVGAGVALVIVLGAIVAFTVRGRNPSEPWAQPPPALPAHDAVANSMFGGAQEIFQQPVAAAPAAPAGPPLPATGLPPGWTMEQWTYYGQQYLNGEMQ